jgi:hypothetical protein
MVAARRKLSVVEVWKREKNSGRFGSGRKFITCVKVEQLAGDSPRVVVDAYSIGPVRGVGVGSRATWFSASEWTEVVSAVEREMVRRG